MARLGFTLAIMSRVDDLLALAEVRGNIGDLVTRVRLLPWDSTDELLFLQPSHICNVLQRFLSGELGAGEVESWAKALECREDIGLGPECKAVLFELANPVLTQPLSKASASHWLSHLQNAG